MSALKHYEELAQKLRSTSDLVSKCDCVNCNLSSEQLSQFTSPKLKFLCKPVCKKVHKPGKLGYMSKENYNNEC